MKPEFRKIDELLKSSDKEEQRLGYTMVQAWVREHPIPRFEVNQKVRITCCPYKLGIHICEGQVGLYNYLFVVDGKGSRPMDHTLLEVEAI